MSKAFEYRFVEEAFCSDLVNNLQIFVGAEAFAQISTTKGPTQIFDTSSMSVYHF